MFLEVFISQMAFFFMAQVILDLENHQIVSIFDLVSILMLIKTKITKQELLFYFIHILLGFFLFEALASLGVTFSVSHF